jgi:hypothetical protein
VAKPVAAGAVERRVDAGAVHETDLVALVDERGAGERQQQDRRGAHVLGADVAREAFEVVVREHPGRALGPSGRLDRRAQPVGVPR